MHQIQLNDFQKYTLKCGSCGDTKELKLRGPICEADKHCGKCGDTIDETNIVEIKQEFLLE